MRLFTVHNLVGDHPEFASTRLFLFNLGMGSFCIDTHCVFHNSLAAIAAVSECIKCQNAPLLAIFLSVMAAAHLGVNKGRLFGLCWNLYRGGYIILHSIKNPFLNEGTSFGCNILEEF